MSSRKSFSAAVRAACRMVCALPFALAGSVALAAQQVDPSLPAAPGAYQAGAAGSALPTPPSVTSSALSGASNLSLSWSSYFEALAILCFALALLWAILWMIKRHGKPGLFSGSASAMRIESRLALGPKKWIIVVRYLDRRLVLGLTDDNISLLTEIPLESGPAEKSAASPLQAAPTASGPGTASGSGSPSSGKKDDSSTDDLFASLLRGGKESESPAK